MRTHLRSQDQASAATYVETAADSLEHWCETLREHDIDDLAGQLQTGAVSMVVAGILLLVGLIGLMHAAINGLARIWPMWLAALQQQLSPGDMIERATARHE